jgi:hypothetical protein
VENDMSDKLKKWEIEPDSLSLENGGYHLLVKRHPSLLHLNGYVGVNSDHPLYSQNDDNEHVRNLSCHGGITFVGNGPWGSKEGYWYFGFDTAHYNDFVPKLMPSFKKDGDSLSFMDKIKKMLDQQSQPIGLRFDMIGDESQYKDVIYVTNEVNELLAQLKEIKANFNT